MAHRLVLVQIALTYRLWDGMYLWRVVNQPATEMSQNEKSMNNSVQQAIVTKYLSPAAVRGSRIKAFCYGGSITIEYDQSLSFENAHRKAAEALRERMKWDGELIQGSLPRGFVFVFAPVARGYYCAICGKMGTKHGHYDDTNPSTHKFVCGPIVFE